MPPALTAGCLYLASACRQGCSHLVGRLPAHPRQRTNAPESSRHLPHQLHVCPQRSGHEVQRGQRGLQIWALKALGVAVILHTLQGMEGEGGQATCGCNCQQE